MFCSILPWGWGRTTVAFSSVGKEIRHPGRRMTIHELQVTPVAVVIAFLVWETDKVVFLNLQFSKYLTQQGFRIVSFISQAEFG